MAEIIENVTFLRFDYPYDTRYSRRIKTSVMTSYNKIYEKLIDDYVGIVRIYYKPLEKNSIIKQPYITSHNQNVARIDKIKYNKIIGSFDIENLINNEIQDIFDECPQQAIFDNVIDLFRKRKFDENCYLTISISGFYEKKVAANSLIVNITNRNLKNFI